MLFLLASPLTHLDDQVTHPHCDTSFNLFVNRLLTKTSERSCIILLSSWPTWGGKTKVPCRGFITSILFEDWDLLKIFRDCYSVPFWKLFYAKYSLVIPHIMSSPQSPTNDVGISYVCPMILLLHHCAGLIAQTPYLRASSPSDTLVSLLVLGAPWGGG